MTGNRSQEIDPREGPSRMATTDENIEKCRQYNYGDRSLKVYERVKTVDISGEKLLYIHMKN